VTHDVALISALYGDYDNLKDPVPQNGDVEYICLTDNPDLCSDVWRMIYWPKPHMPAFLAAKSPKMLPAYYTTARASVWVDMSVQVLSPDFAVEAAECARDGFATWPHPWNPDLCAESAESLRQRRYQGQHLAQQVTRMFANGLPKDTPVRHTAVVARAHNEVTEQVGFRWDAEYEWSMADQIGFVYALWRCRAPHYELPIDQAYLMGFKTPSRSDPWLSHHSHRAVGMWQ
jgi:hypothetical protein